MGVSGSSKVSYTRSGTQTDSQDKTPPPSLPLGTRSLHHTHSPANRSLREALLLLVGVQVHV